MKALFLRPPGLHDFFIMLIIIILPAFSYSQKASEKQSKDETFHLEFSHQQGFYRAPFYLKILNLPENTTIHYTTDGTEPTFDSDTLNNETGLFINYPAHSAEPIALIPTNPLDTPYPWYIWKTPDDPGPVAGIYSLKLFSDTLPLDKSNYLTFLIADHLPDYFYTLPLVSIITDSNNLFNYETGIYVPGKLYDENPVWTWWGGNSGNYRERGSEWEKPGNIIFFEPGGVPAFQQDIGLRVHGGGTRIFPQKSLRIYARSEYGQNKICYPIFPQKNQPDFKRLIISNNGQDFITGSMNDVLVAAMFDKLNLDLQEYRFAITFINGEFWGIQCIRERLDKYFLEDKFGIDEDNVDIISGYLTVEEGDTLAYREMYRFIAQNDLSLDLNYSYIESLIDIDSYIDYNICKQYIGSTDWPGNNVECWREKKAGSKWRWFFYDNNGALINSNSNILENSLEAGGTGWPNPDWSTLILRKLMENEKFRRKYFSRFNELYYSFFQPEYMINVIDSLSNLLTDAFPDHIARWKYPSSMQLREEKIELMKAFASERPAIIRQQIIELFHHDYMEINEPLVAQNDVTCFYFDSHIHIENPLSGTVYFELFDILGKPLKQEQIPALAQVSIDTYGLTGVFLVRLSSGRVLSTQKLIIM